MLTRNSGTGSYPRDREIIHVPLAYQCAFVVCTLYVLRPADNWFKLGWVTGENTGPWKCMVANRCSQRARHSMQISVRALTCNGGRERELYADVF